MHFYEVLADGYHSPLTKSQIAELFHAGRLRRDQPCKHVARKEWQTIDELFPLLKYQPAGTALYYSRQADSPSPATWILIFAFLAAAAVVFALWSYFAYDIAARTNRPHLTARDWPRTISTASPFAPPIPQQEQTDNIPVGAPATTYAPRTTVDLQQAQLAEQHQREQAEVQAERNRLMAERAVAERKATGRDAIIPLDRQTPVNVGGYTIYVMIHENDVTSFDVWINGLRRREVPKQKGITGSRTDETLIYNDGSRARLYYVWEISGELNHCRLRVRED